MTKPSKPKRDTADDKQRRAVEYAIKIPDYIAAFSHILQFIPITDMPHPTGYEDDFRFVFLSAAEQSGLIEYTEDRTKFRWTRKNELTPEENSQLNQKIIKKALNR